MTEIAERESERYPALKEDLETAARILGDPMSRADAEALEYQSKFRRSELAVIWGGVVAVGLAAGAGLTAADAGAANDAPWSQILSFAELVLTAGLGSLAFITRGLKWQRKWLKRRWMAEMLRGERFMFVGRLGAYAGAPDPDRVLRQRIVEIERLVREGGASDG